uniref:Serpin domain-containing protein n=1 Tax=Anopheles farauti TaxID=69004 RepID=A0A2C9GW18_9DIPT
MHSGSSMSWMLAAVLLVTVLVAEPATAQINRGQKQGHMMQRNPQTANTKKVSDSVTNLAQRIASAIANQKSKTEIFSPVSIAGALSLLLLGSGGKTQTELLNVMGLSTQDLSFRDIHISFGRLFQDLVSNEPSLEPLVTWRMNDKCNRLDDSEDYEDEPIPESPNKQNETDLVMKIGNGIFAQKGTMFDPRYDKLAKDLYKSELQQLDFVGNESNSVRVINNWVYNQTHGRIADIVSHINPDTILMIVNTLYFRGLWEEQFQPLATRNRRFFPNGPNGPDSFDVLTMAKSHCMPYYFWEEENVRVVGVPYRQNVTMYIFLPINSTRELVQQLQSKMSAERVNDIVTKMKMKSVSLLFPKMHISNSLSLKNVLQQLGVYTVFDRREADLYSLLHGKQSLSSNAGAMETEDILDMLEDTPENAIFELKRNDPNCNIQYREGLLRGECLKSGCAWSRDRCICCSELAQDFRRRRRATGTDMMPAKNETIFVNEMLHKVDLTVNERGTEGGAATATLIDRISSQINFIVNGPFFMFIREETTRLPLFYGNVYNPK